MTSSVNKLNLMIIVGTRPEIIKLSEVIHKCDKYFNLKIIFLQLKEKQELYFYNIWAQNQTPRRLPPFPDGQSFGQVLRTITFVLWLHAWCRFHTTKRSVTFYSDFSILLNRQLQHPK